MNGLTQTTLSTKIAKDLEATCKRGEARPVDIVFFLASLTWGWARRIGLSSNDFLDIARKVADANERLERKALRIDPTRPASGF